MIRLIKTHPVSTFYGTVVAFSWLCFVVVVFPTLLRGGSMQARHAFTLFPLLVVSVAVAGWLWTRFAGNPEAEPLGPRLRRWRVPIGWYAAAVLIPPAAIFSVLSILSLRSPAFHPGFFGIGIVFGLFPGYLEEIGWTGYLYPQLCRSLRPLTAAVVLGILWACWHIPVVNFLGAAGPHGASAVPFFLAFAAAMTALRVLISWIYVRTRSVPLAQLMHASSTGSLVVFSPTHVSARSEAYWYGCYGVALALVAVIVVARNGSALKRITARPASN